MAEHETSKVRQGRIPLDYFKTLDAVTWSKLILLVLGVMLTVGWIVWGLQRPDRGEAAHAPGPVAAVHAAWADNCNACHVPFTPIRGNTWTAALGSDPLAA